MNAQEIVAALTAAEMNRYLASDCKRVIRTERMSLQAALDMRNTGQGRDDFAEYKARIIGERMREAKRVAEMWGVL